MRVYDKEYKVWVKLDISNDVSEYYALLAAAQMSHGKN